MDAPNFQNIDVEVSLPGERHAPSSKTLVGGRIGIGMVAVGKLRCHRLQRLGWSRIGGLLESRMTSYEREKKCYLRCTRGVSSCTS